MGEVPLDTSSIEQLQGELRDAQHDASGWQLNIMDGLVLLRDRELRRQVLLNAKGGYKGIKATVQKAEILGRTGHEKLGQHTPEYVGVVCSPRMPPLKFFAPPPSHASPPVARRYSGSHSLCRMKCLHLRDDHSYAQWRRGVPVEERTSIDYKFSELAGGPRDQFPRGNHICSDEPIRGASVCAAAP